MTWLLAILLLATCAQADVTRKHTTSSQIMGKNEGTTADYYSADAHATESTIKWTSGFMKTATGGKPTESIQIIRLDKELVQNLDPKKKTYTEMTFAEFRELMQKGMDDAEEAGEEAEEEAAVADTATEEMYEWTMENQSEAGTKVINGWTCKNAKVVATGVNKHDPQDKVIITINTWNSTEVPGADEITAFNIRYLKALGLDELALTSGLMQAAFLYQKQIEAVTEAAKNAPGEPVDSNFEIQRNALKRPSIGKALKEGAANELMGKLPFGKKKQEPKEEAPVYELRTKYAMKSLLTEASSSAVDGAKFEIPAGYKLKD